MADKSPPVVQLMFLSPGWRGQGTGRGLRESCLSSLKASSLSEMYNAEPGNGQLRHRDTMVGLGEDATGEDAGPRGVFRTLKRHTPD